MTPNQLMDRAIEIARSALDELGTLPYGAVVARDGEIIGEGLNRAMGLSDPTSHGEVEAMRDACRKLGTTDLGGGDVHDGGALLHVRGDHAAVRDREALFCSLTG